MRLEEVPSTQDVAREHIDDLPLLVIAASQTRGRGRSGAGWLNADRALAVSLAFHHEAGDNRPFSLMAGVAAVMASSADGLKWPNDLLKGETKVGGILTERRDGTTVIGLGLNLWWPGAPPNARAIFSADPGGDAHAEIAALWGAELMQMLEGPSWPLDRYRSLCSTLGQWITWEPDGTGLAIDIDPSGGLIVDVEGRRQSILAGEVRHVRSGP
jgi:BirA family biotin operon repressor/biotin-[acetyl-CoA-carboxylase] ligase